jgi:exodeoxyribonuclease-3
MKFATWNVNGLRACANSFFDYLVDANADFYALQEIKLNEPINDLEGLDYCIEWNISKRPGYSGTAIFYKNKPLSVRYGFGDIKFDREGRLITLEYPNYYFINVYVPNSQGKLERWHYRLDFDFAFRDYIDALRKNKNIIICGDLNVAHSNLDIHQENFRNDDEQHGFSSEEREGLNELLDLGLVDVFRALNPTKADYTWLSRRRLDYFLVSENIMPNVQSCKIRADVRGSDHVPVEMEIEI